MHLTYALGAIIMASTIYIVWRYLPDSEHDPDATIVEIVSEPPLAAVIDGDRD